MKCVKLVCVGDGDVGKTSLLITYTTNQFPRSYIPTVFEGNPAKVTIDGVTVHLGLWDTAGDRLRPLSYPRTDVFLLFYSINSRRSLINIERKWAPEIQHFMPNTPFFLVANKIDLREDLATLEELEQIGESPINFAEGHDFHLKIGASGFLECSALTGEGIKNVFEAAIRLVMQGPNVAKKHPLGSKGTVAACTLL